MWLKRQSILVRNQALDAARLLSCEGPFVPMSPNEADWDGPPARPAEEECVIRLTRINRTSLAINGDLIKFVESAPDTVITLITGEKVVVTESVEQIIDLIVQFRRTILTGVSCPALGLQMRTASNVASLHARGEGRGETGRTL